MTPRYYQLESISGNSRFPGIRKAWQTYRAVLLVLPTGTGKTIVFSLLTAELVREGATVLIIAHRDELIRQAASKLEQATGLGCAIEKADEYAAGCMESVIVASVQTLLSPARRDALPVPTHIIIDEAHHCVSDSYQAVLAHWPQAKVLGVTATPDRADMRQLGTFFEALAYEYSLPQAIQDKFLCPIRALTLPVQVDLTNIKPANGDFSNKQVATVLDPYIPELCRLFAEHARDRKGLVFVPLCATGRKVVEAFKAAGLRAYYCDGEDRSQIKPWEQDGPGSIMVNAMLLCLDTETEILTETGWVNHKSITMQHRVANWLPDGNVFFDEPLEIVERNLYPSEHMVSINSRIANLRVTNTHRMIVACGSRKKNWKKISAEALSSTSTLPACGVSMPANRQVDDKKISISKRRITANAYNIRKLTGTDVATSRRLATEREIERSSLARAQPGELTADECRLIGFWIADGSMNRGNHGGVEYTLCQSPRYTHIVKWIDDLIGRLGVSACRREKKSPDAIIWSLCRGTGGGTQRRKGLYRIEPYLCKTGTPLFQGLNEQQFDALVEGYWYGDGHHGMAENGMPKSIVFNDTKHSWIELLCSLGPVRGWRCAMYHMPSTNPRHQDQWRLRMIKGADLHLSSSTRITHEPFSPERVWCVKTTSKNIITRRRGKVVVMGNTEGYDHPPINALAVWRFTQSRAFYSQMIGRGTRICEGKSDLLLIDNLFLSKRHQLCRPAILIAEDPEVADAMTDRQDRAGGPVELDEAAIEQAKQDVIAEREKNLAKKLAEMRHKKRELVDPLQYALSIGAPQLANYTPALGAECAAPNQSQVDALAKCGIYPSEIASAGQADRLLAAIADRRAKHLAEPKQIRILERYDVQQAGQLSFEQAQGIIRRIAANGWRKPYKKL